jgi:D-serine deaminase-like pyridoxal phosphate-dependent protein
LALAARWAWARCREISPWKSKPFSNSSKMEWFDFEGVENVASPALLLYRDRIEHNLRQMIAIAGDPARLRPHVKTHKIAQLIVRQVELGITKYKTSTIAEAEMCAAAGAKDVLLAFPPAGPNVTRLCELARRFPDTRFSAIVDNAVAIRSLSVAARDAGLTLDVFLDLDCGMHRTGVMPGPEAFELYKMIAEQPGLRAAGLHAYDGHIHEADLAKRTEQCEAAFAPVLALRKELEAAGLPVPTLTASGSPTFAIHAKHADRELTPGTTVLWDFGYGDKLPDLPFLPAAILLTRVVSKPGGDRLCLDLGHKSVAAENPHPRVRLIEIPEAEFTMQSEEHLVVETPNASKFIIGQPLHGIPRHVCPTVALHNEAVIIDGGRVVDQWAITARGRRISV